jgi:hypothetical protein
MAISGQGCLCAAHLGGAFLLCAAAPAAGQEREERSLDVRVSGTAVHDSNAARSGKAQAAARGLAREEMEFRPSASVSMVLPFDPGSIFTDTQVGYEFHSRNKRLESERIAATGGVRLRMLGCVVEASANYARRLSDMADDFSASPGSVEQITGAGGDLRCRPLVGVSPLASISYKRSRNNLAARRRSDLDSMTATGGIAYEQPSLGRLSVIASLSDQSYPHRLLTGSRRDGIRTVSGMLRLERRAGTLLKGNLSAGYIHVDPNLPGVRGFEGPVYGAELTLAPGGPAAFALGAERTVEASNRLDVSYYRQDQLSLSMRYALGPRVNMDVRGSWRLRRFAPSPAVTDVTPPGSDRNYALGGGLRYVLNRRIELTFDLDYQRRNAAIDLFDYGGLRAGLTAAYRM